MKTKVLILGTLPPPVGGITIHLQRFFQINIDNKEFEINICDIRKRKIYCGNLEYGLNKLIPVFVKSKIVHIHISNFSKILFAMVSKISGKKVIYTQHNSRIASKLFFRFFSFFCNKIILVNDKDIQLGAGNSQNKKFEKIPAFIEPLNIEELPEKISDNLQKYNFIISANCYRNVLFNGEQLYGFDTLIKAYKSLTKSLRIENSILVLVDPSNTMQEIVNDLIIDFESGKNNQILFVGNYIDFSSLIKISKVVVRPTRSDGDALTVREALHFGIPIIASDCSQRPEGTIIFQTGSHEDLSDKIYSVYSKRLENNVYKKQDFNKKILDNYRILT